MTTKAEQEILKVSAASDDHAVFTTRYSNSLLNRDSLKEVTPRLALTAMEATSQLMAEGTSANFRMACITERVFCT